MEPDKDEDVETASGNCMTVTLDVGGKVFRTTTTTLKALPCTRLGQLALQAEQGQCKHPHFFFDRSPKMMSSLLGLYRTGRLHLPSGLCMAVAAEELQFWRVPEELVADCCWRRLHSHRDDQQVLAEIDAFLQNPWDDVSNSKQPLSWRMQLWLTLERPDYGVMAKVSENRKALFQGCKERSHLQG